MKIIVIRRPDMGCYCVPVERKDMDVNDPAEIVAEECRQLMEEASIGDSFSVTLEEVSEEEFAKTEEFKGW